MYDDDDDGASVDGVGELSGVGPPASSQSGKELQFLMLVRMRSQALHTQLM